MKRALLALILAPLTAASFAATADGEMGALRAECAAQHMAKLESAKGGNEYHFVYSQGQYKGEAQAGKTLDCTDAQYAAFLGKSDPNRLMSENPTAAGKKATAKK
ncbi:hypothetical protein [Roseateles violae]|uniref:Uncharacterized protein n=1 Tax=Roseateles violae TaxID=3058042 RepID=A0ABT8DSW8_9BURK|nr:hypothetical protein [Pelomonas sp. PFR6]MDN3921414.1 hypothetical protein [Pelomonas sp. PFR6]